MTRLPFRSLAFGLLALGSLAEGKPKLPPCPPKTPQLYIAPMGEPFRADANAAYPNALWFAQADANHDGRLTLSEFVADADRFFDRLDSDHDGEIIPDELIPYERNMVPEIALYALRRPGERTAGKRPKKGDDAYGGPLGAGRWSILNIPQPVASADADINRAVTRAEFRSAAIARFGLIDSDRRGFLTLAGLPPTPAQTSATACDPTMPQEPPKRGRARG